MKTEPSDIESRISAWLESQGYPLEMTTAAAFQRAGFNVVQSDSYIDQDTKKPREIDVHAYLGRSWDSQKRGIRATFLVECKLSKDKPWVVFSSPHSILVDDVKVRARPTSVLGARVLRELGKEAQSLYLFKTDLQKAHGVIRAFSTGEDVAFAAVTGVLKASIAKAELLSLPTVCHVVFPTIVVDGLLFDCFLGDRGKPIIRQVPEATLYWRYDMKGVPFSLSVIHIVTLPYLEDHIKSIVADWPKFFDMMTVATDSVLSKRIHH